MKIKNNSNILSGIKNIIFDFGGVIINIDYSACVKEFKNFNVVNFDYIYSQSQQITLFDDFEKGFISPDFFRNKIRELFNFNLSDEEIDFAWNKIIIDIPDERVRLLKKLRKKYRIFLLSNTNEIHYKFYNKMFFDKYKYNLSDLFYKAYFSFYIGMKKPDRKIFEFLIKDNDLIPDETLFIDDSIQNFMESEKLGIKSCFIDKGQDIVDIFK